MKQLNGLFVIFAILTVIVALRCLAIPISIKEQEDDKSFEDDMIIALLRNGQRAPARRWPNGKVYYKIAKDYDDSQLASIKSAMAAIEAVTCVRFREASKRRKSYIDIKSERAGCVSAVGYQGRPQKFNLQRNATKCFRVPVIMHELLHTLGFYHQHTAADRDDYITVMWNNIQPGKEKWFSKFDERTVTDFGFGYDYESIMHYGPKGFSSNGMDTIIPLEANVTIGQRLGLSIKDIGKINAMYNCPSDNGDTEMEYVDN